MWFKKAKGKPDSQSKASVKTARLKFSSPTVWPHREGGEGCRPKAGPDRRPANVSWYRFPYITLFITHSPSECYQS